MQRRPDATERPDADLPIGDFRHRFGHGARLSVGRQYSAALSSVSLFDGVTAELNRSRWGLGPFGGLQPDASTMGYSSDIREAGAYVQLHNDPRVLSVVCDHGRRGFP